MSQQYERIVSSPTGERYRISATVANSLQRNVVNGFAYDIGQGRFLDSGSSLEDALRRNRELHKMADLSVTRQPEE